MNKQTISYLIWISTFLVFLLPLIKWGSGLDWEIDEVSPLAIFPLLGLWAFAQMWLHYAIGSVKRRHPEDFDYKDWYRSTGNVVFVLILLHPLILTFETVRAGSTPFDHVSGSQAIYIYSGVFALACFLLYEVADRLQNTEFWKKNFGMVKILSIVAMLAIFWHSFGLGQDLEEGWLRFVWIGMFISFVGFVLDSYTYKPSEKSKRVPNGKVI